MNELSGSIFVDSIFKESFFGSANEAFCFIEPEFEIFPVLLLMLKVLFFCTTVISSVSHANLLLRLTRFSGACLFRTDKNSAFHVEKFMFESTC